MSNIHIRALGSSRPCAWLHPAQERGFYEAEGTSDLILLTRSLIVCVLIHKRSGVFPNFSVNPQSVISQPIITPGRHLTVRGCPCNHSPKAPGKDHLANPRHEPSLPKPRDPSRGPTVHEQVSAVLDILQHRTSVLPSDAPI